VAPAGGHGPLHPLGVLIVCPHRLAREGLRLVVEQDEGIVVVESAADVSEALDLVGRSAPDVVIVGWGWQEGRCVEVVERLHAECPSLPLLVISADLRPEQIQRSLAAGARAFLPADVDLDDLIHAIRTATREETILHPTLVPALLSYLSSGPAKDGPRRSLDALTRRERDVVQLLARGLGDRDMAQHLFISVRTVQTHLSHIYAKLGVHTRTEAALMAVREGWVTLPSDDRTEP
jgi:DNA-binding NarL/FixJ family response regulator